MPENAPSQGIGSVGGLAKWLLRVGHAVDRGEEIVHECVVRVEELAEVQVVPSEMAKEPQGLLSHALGDGLAVVAKAIAVFDGAKQAVEPHPLREESVHRALRRRAIEHPARHSLDLLRASEMAGRRGGEQIRVG